MYQALIKKIQFLVMMLCLSVFSLFLTVAPSYAELDPTVAAMFTSIDISDLKTQVASILMATLIIPLLFVGAKLVKRTIRSAGS